MQKVDAEREVQNSECIKLRYVQAPSHALCVPPGHRADPSGFASAARCPFEGCVQEGGGAALKGVACRRSAEVAATGLPST